MIEIELYLIGIGIYMPWECSIVYSCFILSRSHWGLRLIDLGSRLIVYVFIGFDRRVKPRRRSNKGLKRTTCIAIEVIQEIENCIDWLIEVTD